MLHKPVGVLLAPLFILQGSLLRRRIPILPEPSGERVGTLGQGPRLRLLVLGDSAAAGVGADTLQQSLVLQIAEALSTHHTVEWCLFAKTGATTASTLRALRRKGLGAFGTDAIDVCVTSLGVNDVTSGMFVSKWLGQQRALRDFLHTELKIRKLISCGLPPVHGFPALPQPLRWWLGARATEFDAHLQEDLQRIDEATYLSLRFTDDVAGMARDGFHPGPVVYRQWALLVAELIKRDKPPAASR
jgi:lysophospholipase L1-like esterase